jgi:3-phenylpropionate/cinnamic acid dioxygenase small subunit
MRAASGNELLLQVASLNAAYARCIDSDRLEDWPQFFAEQGTYRVTTQANHARGLELGLIYAEGRGMLTDRITALRRANIYERHRYRHVVGLPSILTHDGNLTTAETPFAVFRTMRDQGSSLFVIGRYLDVLRSAAGVLEIEERLVVCDGEVIDTLLVIPL